MANRTYKPFSIGDSNIIIRCDDAEHPPRVRLSGPYKPALEYLDKPDFSAVIFHETWEYLTRNWSRLSDGSLCFYDEVVRLICRLYSGRESVQYAVQDEMHDMRVKGLQQALVFFEDAGDTMETTMYVKNICVGPLKLTVSRDMFKDAGIKLIHPEKVRYLSIQDPRAASSIFAGNAFNQALEQAERVLAEVHIIGQLIIFGSGESSHQRKSLDDLRKAIGAIQSECNNARQFIVDQQKRTQPAGTRSVSVKYELTEKLPERNHKDVTSGDKLVDNMTRLTSVQCAMREVQPEMDTTVAEAANAPSADEKGKKKSQI